MIAPTSLREASVLLVCLGIVSAAPGLDVDIKKHGSDGAHVKLDGHDAKNDSSGGNTNYISFFDLNFGAPYYT